jgi:FkbM family methyltransferase
MVLWDRTKIVLWEMLTFGGGIARSLDGHQFRICPGIRWLMDDDKEPELRAFMQQRVRPGDVLIDIGAHAGFYVLLFSRWAPNGQIVAFEPNPDTRAFLERHVRLNGLTDRVTVEPLAVSDRAASQEFFMLPGEGRSRLGQTAHADVTQVGKVMTTTLDDYASRNKITPNWLLIDIEGYEIAALRGAARLIQARRNEMTIVVEMHPDVWHKSETSRAEADDLLRELRLQAIPLTGQKDPLSEYGIVHLAPF